MSIASIIIICAIVALSVTAVLIAEDPLDEVFHIEAFLQGFPLQPLATKVPKRKIAHRILKLESAPISKRTLQPGGHKAR